MLDCDRKPLMVLEMVSVVPICWVENVGRLRQGMKQSDRNCAATDEPEDMNSE